MSIFVYLYRGFFHNNQIEKKCGERQIKRKKRVLNLSLMAVTIQSVLARMTEPCKVPPDVESSVLLSPLGDSDLGEVPTLSTASLLVNLLG